MSPFFTVIIPIYNAEATLEKCLEGLLNQSLSNDLYEVILVDNNSTDRSMEIMSKYPFKILKQSLIQSSYASRNLAIHNAKGKVLAFTDSDCRPHKDWLKNAYNIYINNWDKFDIVAGHIEMEIVDNNNPWEIYDKSFFLIQKEYVKNNSAATANLFVKREVFNKIGIFREVISSGDKEFVKRACNYGFKLDYAENTIVSHPTRKTFREILKKSIRIETGKSKIEDKFILELLKRIVAVFYIPRYFYFLRPLKHNGISILRQLYFLKGLFVIRLMNAIFYAISKFKYI